MLPSIDLNFDLGESEDSLLDEQIMLYISSCNIACGGHAGDEKTAEQTIDLAIGHQVAIGAHPSFPDRENFGRKAIQIDRRRLKQSLIEQILLIKTIALDKKVNLHHIKPHGALYNLAAKDEDTSTLVCEVVKYVDSTLHLYGLAHSIMERVAMRHNISFIREAFADRTYESDKTLRSRTLPGAVLTNEDEVLGQVEELVLRQRVFVPLQVSIQAQTICLHSDTKGAVALAKRINEYLVRNGVLITTV